MSRFVSTLLSAARRPIAELRGVAARAGWTAALLTFAGCMTPGGDAESFGGNPIDVDFTIQGASSSDPDWWILSGAGAKKIGGVERISKVAGVASAVTADEAAAARKKLIADFSANAVASGSGVSSTVALEPKSHLHVIDDGGSITHHAVDVVHLKRGTSGRFAYTLSL
ncbi:MAG: hypothetical protein AAF726_02185 [Planctomycetota bacterium]